MRESDSIVAALAEVADPERAIGSARFFKTGPGEYGEGDLFIGVPVPAQRKVAKRFRGVSTGAIDELLASPVHEHRLTALLLLRNEFERSQVPGPWVEQYRSAVAAGRVNNWDLVDSSADPILGEWLWRGGDYGLLLDYARETDLWRRRVGIVGTFAYLKHGSADATLAVVSSVLDDRRDLIGKASGWMLRELGKRVDRGLLLQFLDGNAAAMGRTALSYATEHLTAEQRAHYRSLR